MPQPNDITAINDELNWLSDFIDLRINHYFELDQMDLNTTNLVPPDPDTKSAYGKIILQYQFSTEERLVLALVTAPEIRPAMLDTFFVKNKNYERGFSEFGGINGTQHGGFLPTIETALFLLAGSDVYKRLNAFHLFSSNEKLLRSGLIRKGHVAEGEPLTSASISIQPYAISQLLTGEEYSPDMSANFPAKRIATEMTWNDLILDEEVMKRIDEIKTWLNYQDLLLHQWNLAKKLKPGYRCLFYGPPGTGKTLTATLLGKMTQMPVYRVDLGLVVSKYIGETEKNLNKVFNMAESKKWILFFDEADALFGSRVETSSSNDRHANQEVSFLLQRIEDFDGLVILASNLKGNIDDAFARRFQSMIYFPLPDKEERLQLWKFYFNGQLPIDPSIDFKKLANEYELAGGNIVNILRYSAIKAVERHHPKVLEEDIIEGLRREFRQIGKSV